MKKFLCLVLILILSMGIGCAVGTKNSGNNEIPNDLNFDVPLDYSSEITVWINNYEYEKAMMASFVTSFNKRYPNIKVNVENITPAQYQATLQKASNVPSMMPDIYWVSPQYIGAYRDMDILQPLNGIMEQDAEFSIESVVAESLECCKQANEIWMLPRDFNQCVLYYNKDMFDVAGIAYPSATEAMSADEFNALMTNLYNKLKTSNEKNSYGETYKDCVVSSWDVCMTWDSVLWPFLKSFGAQIITEDGTYMNGEKALFNSKETMDAYEWVMDITQSHLVEASQATHMDGLAFKMERSPMYSHMRCNLNDLITPNGQYKGIQNLGIAPFPNLGKQDNYYIGSGATGYAISSKTDNLVASWLFLKSIVSEQSQEEVSKTGYATPSNKAVLDDPNSEWRRYTDQKVGTGYNEPFVYRRAEAYTHVNQFLNYIDYKYQNSVWFDMGTMYCQVADLCKTAEEAQVYIDLYSNRMAQYIREGQE